ncbi:hypothetical protein D7Z26_03915 [Cohnella endophytica]|uniref:AlgX/AlgJ SGNH hydrolase-like domain-containing protein n=1 Tax=Cohnella endophytica TaxID=2419778 RepID=A0A494Y329_9BACL|nr:DHHW family protein [Cohnella endophytica]RKP57137.1 hypothetical protein D7Z26_03915 [Cohnella endophytica]
MKLQVKLNLLLFLVFIFGFGAVNLLGKGSQGVSQLEQRDIAKSPEFTVDRFFGGEYTRDYDNYFSDNFAYRTSLVQVGTSLKELKGFQGGDGASIIVQGGDNMAVDLNKNGGDNGKGDANAGTTPGDSSTVTDASAVKYLVLKDRAFTLFTYSASAAEMYAEALNRFKKEVGTNVNVYSLLAPTSAEFIDNDKYRAMSASQKKAFDHINERLDASIGQVNAYGALDQHQSEYVFFRTDHHWTALGAYYAYVEFMKTIGEKPVALDKYKKVTMEGFLGTAYKATLSDKLKSHPDTLTYYTPFTDYKYTLYSTADKAIDHKVVDAKYGKQSSSYYAAFLGGDFPWGEIDTKVKNGKSIAVVKDSYANSFIPFLLPHYEKIYYIDPRYFKQNMVDFVKKQKITDVLFLNNSTVARQNGIAKLLNDKMDIGK